MGMTQHDAFVITGYGIESMKKLRDKAIEIFNNYKDESGEIRKYKCVSEMVGTEMNEDMTFLIAPDGSKEYWKMSDDFDKKRLEYMEYLKTQYYDDGSAFFKWVLVSYGETGRRVVKSNCKNMY